MIDCKTQTGVVTMSGRSPIEEPRGQKRGVLNALLPSQPTVHRHRRILSRRDLHDRQKHDEMNVCMFRPGSLTHENGRGENSTE